MPAVASGTHPRRGRVAAAVMTAAALLAACGGEGEPEKQSRGGPTAPRTTPSAEGRTTASAQADAPGRPSLTGVIPDDFPLLEGLPTDDEQTLPGRAWGRMGPQRAWNPERFPLALGTCGNAGAPARMPRPTDSLYAAWFDVASAHDRQLMVFVNEDQAMVWADMLSSAFSCKRETEGEVTTFYEPFSERPHTADVVEGWVTRHESKGRPGPAGVVHVVVKGRAALLSKYYAGEGSQVDRAESRRMQDDELQRIATIIEAM